MGAFIAKDTEVVGGTKERQDMIGLKLSFDLRCFIFQEEGLYTLIIVFGGGINVSQYIFISFPECINIHGNNNARCTVYIVP